MSKRRAIELLAPAKNKLTGIAAIKAGADAIYIGAGRFGARAAAGNTIEDISELCDFAHNYGAKVYVTVNTIIYDEEMQDARKLIDELIKVDVDAVLLQDMGLLVYARGKIEVHASTQTDNRTPEKVKWLKDIGFSRAVLARELSLNEIKEIHNCVPDIELEAFVHGALCVSYSGACYASEFCFNRSANRGECAQFCRMKFDLINADDEVIVENQHLLSMKDMCRIDSVEQLVNTGVTSLKIEGRLKDENYVKNVVAAYSNKLNEIIERNPDKYERASLGRSNYGFIPNLKKTFNRDFTEYFLHKREPNIFQPYSAKAFGELVGKVKEFYRNSIVVSGIASFSNGDGLCYFNKKNELIGFRVNRAEGNRLFPQKMPTDIFPGILLYRNYDKSFEELLSDNKMISRKIGIKISLQILNINSASNKLVICVKMAIPYKDIAANVSVEIENETAKSPQKDNIIKQLSKLGDTCFEVSEIDFDSKLNDIFIRSSFLSSIRRECVLKLQSVISEANKNTRKIGFNNIHNNSIPESIIKPYKNYKYLCNIANSQAHLFYNEEGLEKAGSAFEVIWRKNKNRVGEMRKPILMQCRHCIRYSLGICNKNKDNVGSGINKKLWKEPVSLRLGGGRIFKLEFDCKSCQMNIYAQ